MLVECIVYIAVGSVITGLAFAAFYAVLDNSTKIRRNADDIARVLHAGEIWREDIRGASGPIRLVTAEGTIEYALHIPQRAREVIYFFDGTNVLRQAAAEASWIEALRGVAESTVIKDQRQQVTAWRWELELKPSKKKGFTRPLFSFEAVPKSQERP